MSWLLILAGVLMVLAAAAGVILTAITLPGTWAILLAALLIQWWSPGGPLPFDWWTLGACAALALAGEVFEFGASALGAKKAGGSSRGAIGAAVGSLLGAIAGAPFLFLIGAIIGAVVGAALGAIIAERAWAGRTWKESGVVGSGAAAGRLAASIVKVGVAGLIGVTLVVAVFNR
jgi:uncharacterized protein YqgC (DUF456 family)